MQVCIEALYQLVRHYSYEILFGADIVRDGVGLLCSCSLFAHELAWADVSEALDSVMLAMERMTPSNDQLEQYILLKTEADDRIVLASRIAGSNDQRLLERAMSFWPPQ